MKDIKKVFENISSCFLMAYTSDMIKKGLLKYSTSFKPVLHDSGFFYNDFRFTDIRNISKTQANLTSQIDPKDLIVEIKFQEAHGLPIPQNNLKGQILRRFINVAFYDMSTEAAKHSLCSV